MPKEKIVKEVKIIKAEEVKLDTLLSVDQSGQKYFKTGDILDPSSRNKISVHGQSFKSIHKSVICNPGTSVTEYHRGYFALFMSPPFVKYEDQLRSIVLEPEEEIYFMSKKEEGIGYELDPLFKKIDTSTFKSNCNNNAGMGLKRALVDFQNLLNNPDATLLIDFI